jgi:phage gp36-like protein
MVPIAGFRLQVTAVFRVLATVALNCCVWAAYRLEVAGATDTLTGGQRFTVAVADLVGSAKLVTVTVTACDAESDAGVV